MKILSGIDPREIAVEDLRPIFMVVHWYANDSGDLDLAVERFLTDLWVDEAIEFASSVPPENGQSPSRIEIWVIDKNAEGHRYGALVWCDGTDESPGGVTTTLSLEHD